MLNALLGAFKGVPFPGNVKFYTTIWSGEKHIHIILVMDNYWTELGTVVSNILTRFLRLFFGEMFKSGCP